MANEFRSAVELLNAMRAGEVSSVEIVDDAIARIEAEDGEVNAVCVRDFDNAREAARAADGARGRGEERALLGLPITVKESYNVAGLPTTWGMPEFRDFVPHEDAVAVARVKDAGAVVLGKTNVPLMLGDLQSFNEIYGATNNPWDLGRSPGGSSGGSAAALASGYGPLSLGSDIAGSLRTPAHFCGVYAHKPSFGVVANRGHVPPPAPALPSDRELAVVGPLARTARDLTLLFDVMAGPDPLTQGVAFRLDLPGARHDRLADFRVLVLDEHPVIPTSAAVRTAVDGVASALTHAGARVRRESALAPDLNEAAELYMQMLMATLAAGLPDAAYAHMREVADGLPADASGTGAASLRGAVATYRDWATAAGRREVHRAGWRALFREFDAVVCPVTPTPAFQHDRTPDVTSRVVDIDGVPYPFGDQLVWAGLATMPGLPATAVPAGRTSEGLPVGVQLVGPMFSDHTVLRLAELLEREIGGFVPPSR
ncbi:amidase [Tsukamurella sp. 8F]|uniref:amidase n=1 Tax=unclassified Tsukamurella TaxID=2633480 RepID=UPI0023B91791|nr:MULTISPECIES: amidase [unclassified Tsukamurella]MDF0531407.1 amidase [Tsukamurella sp. 8J]MDF0585287.1 amidase [Tsukamurella sp. 8F]